MSSLKGKKLIYKGKDEQYKGEVVLVKETSIKDVVIEFDDGSPKRIPLTALKRDWEEYVGEEEDFEDDSEGTDVDSDDEDDEDDAEFDDEDDDSDEEEDSDDFDGEEEKEVVKEKKQPKKDSKTTKASTVKKEKKEKTEKPKSGRKISDEQREERAKVRTQFEQSYTSLTKKAESYGCEVSVKSSYTAIRYSGRNIAVLNRFNKPQFEFISKTVDKSLHSLGVFASEKHRRTEDLIVAGTESYENVEKIFVSTINYIKANPKFLTSKADILKAARAAKVAKQ